MNKGKEAHLNGDYDNSKRLQNRPLVIAGDSLRGCIVKFPDNSAPTERTQPGAAKAMLGKTYRG